MDNPEITTNKNSVTAHFVSARKRRRREEFGDVEDVLGDHWFLADRARRLIERGVVPTEDGWGDELDDIKLACGNTR